MRRSNVNEVNRKVIECCLELRPLSKLGLGISPVVAIAPVGNERLHCRQRRTLVPAVCCLALRPPDAVETAVQIVERCVGRAKASTSITTTAATQTITSGAIKDQLMIGIMAASRPSEFVALQQS